MSSEFGVRNSELVRSAGVTEVLNSEQRRPAFGRRRSTRAERLKAGQGAKNGHGWTGVPDSGHVRWTSAVLRHSDSPMEPDGPAAQLTDFVNSRRAEDKRPEAANARRACSPFAAFSFPAFRSSSELRI